MTYARVLSFKNELYFLSIASALLGILHTLLNDDVNRVSFLFNLNGGGNWLECEKYQFDWMYYAVSSLTSCNYSSCRYRDQLTIMFLK